MDKIKSWQNGIYKESACETQMHWQNNNTHPQKVLTWKWLKVSIFNCLIFCQYSMHILGMYSEAHCVKKFVPNLPFYTFFLFSHSFFKKINSW